MLMPMQEVVFAKKAAHSSSSSVPLVCMVCRKVMPGRRYFSTSVHGAPVEVQPHQRWLAALPGDVDAVRLVRLDELADVLLQHRLAHAELAAGVEDLLVQEEAVGAVQVADRAGRLRQQVKGRRRAAGSCEWY